jgi:hypothetical protein
VAKKKQLGGKRKGAGRKVGEGGPAVVVAVSVPKSLADQLDKWAKSNDWTRSKAVTEALRTYLKRAKGA